MSKRPKVPSTLEAEVLQESRRRCCLCVYIDDDKAYKRGQIAHLDRNKSNNKKANLVFLCLPHHDEYDSRTSVSKGLTMKEVKRYRNRLHGEYGLDTRPLSPLVPSYRAKSSRTDSNATRRQRKPSADQITVALVDDHPVVIKGIRSLLEYRKDIKIVAQATDGLTALRLVCELKPRVLLADITMPKMDGMKLLKQVRKSSPNTKVIMLTVHDPKKYLEQALRCGANGYLRKDASEGELVESIRQCARGQYYFAGSKAKHLIRVHLEATSRKRGC